MEQPRLNSRLPLHDLQREVTRIGAILATLTSRANLQSDDPSFDEVQVICEQSTLADFIRKVIRARRLRDQFLAAELFADPAWDILLDLMAARLERRQVAVSSLCIAAAVPPTTALRWIKALTEQKLLIRIADPRDGRRVFIELAEQTADNMSRYMETLRRANLPFCC